MQTKILALVLITILGLFLKKYLDFRKDEQNLPAQMSFIDWLKKSALEIGINVAIFVLVCFGIELGTIVNFVLKLLNLQYEVPEVLPTTYEMAIPYGMFIYNFVKIIIMPALSQFFGVATARKELRERVTDAVEQIKR